MRLLFVNHCHPETPHVCATRLREFAFACAHAGHSVVLLTETLPDEPASHTPRSLAQAIRHHDWSRPLTVAARPVPGRIVTRLREGQMPRWLRRPLLAAAYLTRSGLFTDWRDGSRPLWSVLAADFRPERCWATFGNTDALVIARNIARLAGCPWIMDIKDPWSVFIPAPFRRLLARRFSSAAALTALSAQHAEDAVRWFGRPAHVIYSGIDDGFLPPPPPPPDTSPPRILLVGGLYAGGHLDSLLRGIAAWRQDAIVVHAGSEGARFEHTARQHGLASQAMGWVTLSQLRALAADSAAIAYVRNPTALYQHKLVELLALERPVLCLPEEAAEALALAERVQARFRSCPDAQAVAHGLSSLVGTSATIDRSALAALTWNAQAGALLEILEAAS